MRDWQRASTSALLAAMAHRETLIDLATAVAQAAVGRAEELKLAEVGDSLASISRIHLHRFMPRFILVEELPQSPERREIREQNATETCEIQVASGPV